MVFSQKLHNEIKVLAWNYSRKTDATRSLKKMGETHPKAMWHVEKKGGIYELCVLFHLSSKLKCCRELARSTTHSLETPEQAFSSPGDVPAVYWSVFQRWVERLSHATDHEHSSFTIADEILVGSVPLDHFRNGNERSI